MSFAIFFAAAAFEILGCWLVMLALRGGALWLLLPALGALAAFASLLASIDTGAAGRTFAVYGGIYIGASLAFMAWVERIPPDPWDLLGACICLVGAGVIFFAPRAG